MIECFTIYSNHEATVFVNSHAHEMLYINMTSRHITYSHAFGITRFDYNNSPNSADDDGFNIYLRNCLPPRSFGNFINTHRSFSTIPKAFSVSLPITSKWQSNLCHICSTRGHETMIGCICPVSYWHLSSSLKHILSDSDRLLFWIS